MLGIAQGGRAGGQPPGQVVVMISAGLGEFGGLLHVGTGLLSMAQAIVDLAAQLVKGGIAGKCRIRISRSARASWNLPRRTEICARR